jgi:hypothetical protein
MRRRDKRRERERERDKREMTVDMYTNPILTMLSGRRPVVFHFVSRSRKLAILGAITTVSILEEILGMREQLVHGGKTNMAPDSRFRTA